MFIWAPPYCTAGGVTITPRLSAEGKKLKVRIPLSSNKNSSWAHDRTKVWYTVLLPPWWQSVLKWLNWSFSPQSTRLSQENSLYFRAQVKSFITVVYKHSDVPLLWLEWRVWRWGDDAFGCRSSESWSLWQADRVSRIYHTARSHDSPGCCSGPARCNVLQTLSPPSHSPMPPL